MAGRREGPGILHDLAILVDRSKGVDDPLGHLRASPVGRVREVEDGRITALDGGWWEPRSISWSKLDTPATQAAPGVLDQRAQPTILADHDGDWGTPSLRDNKEPWYSDYSPQNGSTRCVDYRDGRAALALEASRMRVSDDLSGKYGAAWVIAANLQPGGKRIEPPIVAEVVAGGSQARADALAWVRPGAGALPGGLVWDGTRNGIAETVFEVRDHDTYGAGRDGTQNCILGIRTDAHFEAAFSATLHGAIHFTGTPDLTQNSEPPNLLRYKASLSRDDEAANRNSGLGKEALKWRPWGVLPCLTEKPRDGIPGSPTTPDGFRQPDPTDGGVLAIPITFVGLPNDSYRISGPDAAASNWRAGAMGFQDDTSVGSGVAAILGQVVGGTTHTDSFQTAPNLIIGTRNSYPDATQLNAIVFGSRTSAYRIEQDISSGTLYITGDTNVVMSNDTFDNSLNVNGTTGTMQWSGSSFVNTGTSTLIGNVEMSGDARVFGDMTIDGKATISGGVDPIYLELTDGTGGVHAADYAAVAPVASARLRYNDVTRSLQTSIDGQPYADLVAGTRRRDGEMLDFAVAMACQQAAMADQLGT